MDGLEFLEESPAGTATLVIQPANAQPREIHNLSISRIKESCPTLASQFHHTKDDVTRTCVLKRSSITAGISFLRYLYLGEYALYQADVDVLIPPLLHLQLFRLAEQWDLPDLQQLVITHLTNNTDPTWGNGYHPMDLCEAIRYLYVEMATRAELRKILADYCVANFVNDGLQSCEYFRQTVYECPPFLRDLCRANMDNGFSHPSAFDIINLPVCRHPSHNSKTIDPAWLNFNCAFHKEEEEEEKGGNVPLFSTNLVTSGDSDVENSKTVVVEQDDDSSSNLLLPSSATSPRISEASEDSHGFTVIPIGDFEWTMLQEMSNSENQSERSGSESDEWTDSEFGLVMVKGSQH